jgi:ribulose-phosphate 3-epimerase
MTGEISASARGRVRAAVDSGVQHEMSQVKLAPSILAADFARLGEAAAAANRGGADRLHIDVMDGHFVPNISIGPVVVRSLRPATSLKLEAHLMIEEPDRYLDAFAEAGADGIIVHQEGAVHLHRTVERIRALGKRVGVAINPATPAETLEEILPDVDLVLVMTVNPGFGGQKFIQRTVAKIRRVRAMIERLHPACELEVDGGIGEKTAPIVVEAGADVLVAGSAIFGAPYEIEVAMRRIAAAVAPRRRGTRPGGAPATVLARGVTPSGGRAPGRASIGRRPRRR